MNDSCVYVSLSYHPDLFESSCLPALGNNTGSFMLLDIAAALDWVRANIEASGRDSENVTVSGFSAGVRNVMTMLMSPLFEGKFDKAIAYSGGMTTAELEPSQ
jgi:para-nitrobenzyl esterase